MTFFSSTKTDLLAMLGTDGEALTYTSRDGGSEIVFTSVLHRNGDDGDAIVNIPSASVAAPVFADKIVDSAGVTWYVTTTRETLQGRTVCDLKQSTYWQTVDIYEHAGGSWGVNTSNVLCIITANSSFEDFDEFAAKTTEYTVRMRYLADPDQRMYLLWGSKKLFVTGIRPDETYSRWMELDVREDEA